MVWFKRVYQKYGKWIGYKVTSFGLLMPPFAEVLYIGHIIITLSAMLVGLLWCAWQAIVWFQPFMVLIFLLALSFPSDE